jgi:hypothetical protein
MSVRQMRAVKDGDANPFGGLNGDQPIVGSLTLLHDTVAKPSSNVYEYTPLQQAPLGPPPRVDEPRLVPRAPTEVRDIRCIRRLLVEAPDVVDRECLERAAAAATIREHVEQAEHARKARRPERAEEVVRERAPVVRRRDRRHGQHVERQVRCEVRREVPAVKSALRGE